MAITVHMQAGAGHPWEPKKRRGFDLLFINAQTESEMDSAVDEAVKDFWQPWLIGTDEQTGRPGGVLYKPSGITEPWKDSPDNPHPGASIAQNALQNGDFTACGDDEITSSSVPNVT